ncbi:MULTISPECIES: GNAT family N-acetyltransferase [Cyanophyceae]|uniref:GNAT family N-acetyltransferase n=1 Tax=Cyanophyceae TaxID=3028117 RepID=UPI0016840456|nr:MULTISPECIES: GNAT family N-acetyltransferase [Cyanophyceae]MBD1918265.1 GNAT family N-acetyltransferase [Phormidium sp. FACHB-77]MBD2031309.1 GNAT family N-acetyltransferase [Phormidium sp. FACHB-322]MBD2052376.1 GNAT family N-acetyltransferase [Leptolyngbya sp. FACHB-60]
MAILEASTQVLADGTKVTIRSAIPEDAVATLSLFRSVVEEGFYTLAEPTELTTTVEDEQATIAEDQECPGNLCLVAEVESEIVGMIRAESGSYRRTRHFADIDSMWVETSWRGRGISNVLIISLLNWAKQHPTLEKLGLFVFSNNTRAIKFYKKHGFVTEGRYSRDMKLGENNYVATVAMGLLIKPRDAPAK